jgi:hypothetical protein
MEEKVDLEKVAALFLGCILGFIAVDCFLECIRIQRRVRAYVIGLRFENLVLTELVRDAYAEKAPRNGMPFMSDEEREAHRATS